MSAALAPKSPQDMTSFQAAAQQCVGVSVAEGPRCAAFVHFVKTLATLVKTGHIIFTAALDQAVRVIMNALPESNETRKASTDLEVIRLTLDLRDAITAYERLGTPPLDKVIKDSQREFIANILRRLAALLAHVGIFDTTYTLPADCDSFVKAAIDDATEMTTSAKLLMQQRAKDSLMERLTGAEQWAGGGAQGEVWHSSLDTGAALEVALQCAKESLMQRKPDEYDRARSQIDASFSEYKEVCDMLSLATEPDVDATTQKVQLRLSSSHCEGLLVALFANVGDDRRAFRRKVMSVKGRISEDDWATSICAVLQRRTIEAIRLK